MRPELEEIGMGHLGKADLAIFCGAGISRNSGLPLASELTARIISRLTKNPADREVLNQAQLELPFEAFMDVLFQNGLPLPRRTPREGKKRDRDSASIAAIQRFLNLGLHWTDAEMNSRHAAMFRVFNAVDFQPNAAHRLVARLIDGGHVRHVVTTNFDLLLERACFDLLLNRAYQSIGDVAATSSACTVLYKESQFASWAQMVFSGPSPLIVKIHGSAHDLDSIRTTLEQVGARQLSEPRAGVVKHLFGNGPHKKVLVLGYSCSDAFDIVPVVGAVGSTDKTVYYVQHVPALAVPRIVPLGGNQAAVEGLSRTDQELAVRVLRVFRRLPGYLVQMDADSLVRDMLALVGEKMAASPASMLQERTGQGSWEDDVDAWIGGLDTDSASGCLAKLMDLAGRPDRSIAYHRGRIRRCKRTKSWEQLSIIYDSIASEYVRMGPLRKANRYLDMSKDALRMEDSPPKNRIQAVLHWMRRRLRG